MLNKDDTAILEDISAHGLGVTKRPFLEAARRLGMPEQKLVERVKGLKSRGVIKELRGVLNHKKAGCVQNALVAWRIRRSGAGQSSPDAMIRSLIASNMVSHCYEREPDKAFDYDIFTMLHAKERSHIDEFARKTSSEFGADYVSLFTEKELKKEKMDLAAVLNKKPSLRGRSPKQSQAAENALVGGVNSPVRNFSAVGRRILYAKKAKGAYLWDEDGKRYVDYIMSWGVSILGHAWKGCVDAAVRSVRNGSTFGLTTQNEVTLAGMIKSHYDSIEKIRFVTSGTEACMTAIRLARAFTRREKIIKFDGCYHGHSDGLLVKSGSGSMTFGTPSSDGVVPSYAAQTISIPFNDTSKLRETIEKNRGGIACVIVEPVPCNTGVILPKDGFLRTLREVTKKEGIILIFDEVITGFRLALGGAQSIYGISPDLTCLGKIIGGGFPAAAVGGRRDIMKLLAPEGPVYQAGTLAANPVSVAAGIAVLEELTRDKTMYKDLAAKTMRFTESIKTSAARHGIGVCINAIGSVFTVFFTDRPVDDQAGAYHADNGKYSYLFGALLERGILLPPSPYEACFVSRAHGDQELEQTKKAFEMALSVMEGA